MNEIKPMLAYGSNELPVGEEWLFEMKWDGYRCIARIAEDGYVEMQSRAALVDYGDQFPEVREALTRLGKCVLDGELVVLDENGGSSFGRMRDKRRASLVVFDLLELGDVDLRGFPLEKRREALEMLVTANSDVPRLAISPAFDDGEALLRHVAKEGLEGVIAKKRSSRYVEDSRSGEWLKIKVTKEQEFIVIGWQPGEGKKAGMAGALHLAVNDEADRLVYAGRVGTGMSYDVWQGFTKLAPLTKPLTVLGLGVLEPDDDLSHDEWVEPELVVQVRFQRWTEDGYLFHPALVGIREDKRPALVVREP
jgi:bifunctional non-homologous end joining protein LigD